MKGHHSVPKGKRLVIWFHSGRVVIDRFEHTDGALIFFRALGAVRAKKLRRFSIYRADMPLPPGTEVLE